MIVGILLILQIACSKTISEVAPTRNFDTRIPITGNAWVKSADNYVDSDILTKDGIRNWNNKKDTIRTFFHVDVKGEISLGFSARVSSGTSKIKAVLGNQSKEVILDKTEIKDVFIGDFQIEKTGYHFIDIIGLEKNGIDFADIDEILIGGVDNDKITYIRDEFYWGKRGPSVHLNYEVPFGVENIEWFYSELLVPENQDVVGSYFMANGFGEGYFGIQVNSPSERRILFSVWSPYQTDDPSSIPEDYKIKLLKKGEGVISGEFGNEGSGGQSYKIFNWKTDVKYRFLIGAKQSLANSTDYVAYFYDPEVNSWNLLAQFRRPKTSKHLTGLYSFLENFIPVQGVFERKAYYDNQWVYNTSGWAEITKIRFTADDTARRKNRLDYSGGIENNIFFLKNCGFTNDQTQIDSYFIRDKLNIEPNIDFDKLE